MYFMELPRMVMDSSYNPFLQPLRLTVAIPTSFYITLVMIHLPAVILPWFAAIPLVFKVVTSLAVLVSFFYYMIAGRLIKTANTVEQVVLDSNDDWQLVLVNGDTLTATFGERHYIHPVLTILELRLDSKNYFFLFTPENADADSFRRLRVRIKHRLNRESELA